MSNMLLLVSIFLTLWISCVHGQGRTCDFPQIKHGAIYDEGRYRHTFPVVIGKHFYYSCHQNFVSPSQKPWTQITCTEDGWWPTPKCLRQCFFPWVENGQSEASGQIYLQGATVPITCDAGYSLPDSQSTITCGESGWSPQPICSQTDTDCSNLPDFGIAIPIGPTKTSYRSGEQVSYSCPEFYQMDGSNIVQCINSNWIGSPTCRVKNAVQPKKETRYRPHEIVRYECVKPFNLFGSVEVVCLNGTWTKTPQCKDSKGKCGTPPPIDNGDITSVPLHVYAPGSRIEYQCQYAYTMEGRATITCQNGEWTEPPRCLDPCVISEDIMNKHKIQFKWVHEKKFYARSGDYVEFACKRGYYRRTNAPFRTQCIEGKLTYPTCG